MSSTLLDVTRNVHEEVERLQRLVVKDLQREPATKKERLYQNHRVRNMIDSIMVANNKLIEIYEDNDHGRKDEIATLGGQGPNGQNVFGAFYDSLKEIREYHRRHPIARIVDAADDPEELLEQEPRVEFSGEEAFGRYLDMHEVYNEYVNSKFGRLIEYSAFLEEFPQTHIIPRNHKLRSPYKEYLEHLLEYLISFFQRTQPLQDLDKIFSKVEAEFEERWADGRVHGWEDKGLGNGQPLTIQDSIDLDYYSSAEELAELGPEKLKQVLAGLGLKTGGTVRQRAERFFLTKFTPLEELDRKHFVNGSRPSTKGTDHEISRQVNAASKAIALKEVMMQRLCELLQETVEETKANIEKKQALTYEEIEAEREEEEFQAESESDEDNEEVYNPLKLPTGWDGKPIPYWLYKLHGLGQEFKCEICGNHSYWGRRAFEKHFKEWRHQHGMRCLGVPNTKCFNEITSIEEAKDLWERIQQRQQIHKWRPDLQEEYEDREGNVYNKKTYSDLNRQGLI